MPQYLYAHGASLPLSSGYSIWRFTLFVNAKLFYLHKILVDQVESLQYNNMISKINKALTKKIIAELAKKDENEPEEYLKFWNEIKSDFNDK